MSLFLSLPSLSDGYFMSEADSVNIPVQMFFFFLFLEDLSNELITSLADSVNATVCWPRLSDS